MLLLGLAIKALATTLTNLTDLSTPKVTSCLFLQMFRQWSDM